jgi:endonuclease YncB( thermonuclease family)
MGLRLIVTVLVVALFAPAAKTAAPVYRVDHVVDGDTIVLRNGQRVRLVQIDTPEVFFGAECYGRFASAQTKEAPATGDASAPVRGARDRPS